ncbi:nose resistant to fluoxetine protein 6 [Caerostris darwini]|uniref:Nose resistant to fluoxetine protein 6 n=1 Tax=Caerostris darwini TaxID=1538125 RepID=A0AAV4UZ13_9ARAC|nr:nose resistant to fluoxetine protein 6 [Caerostris darwini]
MFSSTLLWNIDNSLAAKLNRTIPASAIFPDYPPTDLHSEEKEPDDGELKTFAEVENKIKSVIENIIKKALPFVIRSSGDIRLSGKCMAGIFKMVIGMQKLEEWALRTYHATILIGSGYKHNENRMLDAKDLICSPKECL